MKQILYNKPNTIMLGANRIVYDLKDYIEYRIENGIDNYNIHIDKNFRISFNSFLINHNCKFISNSTFTRAIKELRKRKVLLHISKGYYLYNFVDCCHVGNRKQYINDIKFFEIEKLLNKVDNN